MQNEGRLYIGGEFSEASDGKSFEDVNPATEDVIGHVSMASAIDVDKAVASSVGAQREWVGLSASQRGAVLYEIAEAIEKYGPELAELDCLDGGRPILDCKEDIHAAVAMFRYFAGMADKIQGETLPVQNDKLCFTKREPYGVIGAITAWNYPLFNACAKVAPILATGNSCVLKPAEESPLTALRLGEVVQAVPNVPTGLLNVINGPGDVTGEALVRHPSVGKISFTGSTTTGRRILHASAESNLKGVVLELGGKSPFIIFADADIDMALNAVTFSMFYNQGQTCTAGTRLLVDRSIFGPVLAGLEERVARIKIGLPEHEDTKVGPLISRNQFDRVEQYVQAARLAGLTPKIGGRRPQHLAKGYFYEPTIFVDPPTDSPLARDEIFGPVLVVCGFGDEDEAITLANDTPYGLAASVWSRSNRVLLKSINSLQAGIVWCNTVFAEHPGAPAGGYKQSGFGREYGKSAVDEYTRLKTVWISTSGEFFSWS